MNITTSLSKNAKRHPGKPAITFEGKTYSYQKLNEEVNRFANGLLQKGLQKGDKVSLFMKNSDHVVIAFYAVLKAGGVAVPVNFRLNAEESANLFGQSESKFILCDAELEAVVTEAKQQAPNLRHVIVHPAAQNGDHLEWNEARSDDVSEPELEVQNTDDAEILYTSGTAGKPKGALFDHQRIINTNMAFIMGTGLTADDRLLHAAPLVHSSQLNLYLLTGIMLGTSNVILRDFDPEKTMEAIDESGITVFFGLPVMYRELLEASNEGKYKLTSIEKCMYGDDAMAPELVGQAMKLFAGAQFYNLCYVTEGGPGGIHLLPEEHKTNPGAGGKAMFFTEARVVDDEFQDVQPGSIGEFVMKGETVMKEYFGLPEETEAAFSDGWLLTGDLATMDEEGYVTFIDRKEDRIISAGENIYAAEVEQVINNHPQVQEAATVGLPEEEWGEIVGLVIVPKEGELIEEAEMMKYCREHLDHYKIPWKFIYVDALPRNASGKIQKYQLRELHISEFTWFTDLPNKR